MVYAEWCLLTDGLALSVRGIPPDVAAADPGDCQAEYNLLTPRARGGAAVAPVEAGHDDARVLL